MGMHLGMLAVKADVGRLVEAFSTVWPTYEPHMQTTVSGIAALAAWMRANEQEVSAAAWSLDNPGTCTFGFWQDGEWAVLWDPRYVMVSDADELAALSERFEIAVSFVIETFGGTAHFCACKAGQKVRELISYDDKLVRRGERLPEEAGLSDSRFYMNEIEQLMIAFGVAMPYDLPADAPLRGAAFIDRTDYEDFRKSREARVAAENAAKRPWWRVW